MNKDFRLKVKSVDEDGTFEGYASTWGVDLEGDRVDPSAFNRSLKNFRGTVPILWDHDSAHPAGVSIELEPDAHGLRLKGRLLLSTTVGREAYEYLKAKVVKGLSIGAEIIKADFDGGVRVLKELRLHEISLCAIPANPTAEVYAVKHCDNCPNTSTTADSDEPAPEPVTLETKALPTGDSPQASDPDQVHSLAVALDALMSAAIYLKECRHYG